MRLLVAMLALGAPPPAVAPPPPPPPPPSVLVVVLPQGPEQARLAAALGPAATTRLARRLPGEAVPLELALNPRRAEDRGRAVVEARAQVLDGIAAFESLELAAARESLEEAVEGLVAHLPDLDPAGRLALAQGLFAYATSVLFEGQTVAADQLFGALAVLEPGFQPESGRYPSNVVQRFEDLLGRAGTRATGALDIYTNPPGAEVYVDGGFRGHAPLTVGDLTEGAHAVTARHPAFDPVGRLAVVEAEEAILVDLPLQDVDASAAWRALTPATLDDAGALARALAPLEADRVALLVLGPGGVVRGRWWQRSPGKLLGTVPPTPVPDAVETAAGLVADALVASEAPSLVSAAPEPEPEVPGAPLTERWWFWAAVGTVVVAAGLSTAVVVARGGEEGPPRNTAVFRF